jgi:hypothetical protein
MEKMEQIPQVWAPDCKYCQSQQMWGSTHESEIMDKARKMCSNPLFPDIVYAQLDTLDHAKATPTEQIRYLTKIHDLTNCECLSKIIGQIQDRMHHTGQAEVDGCSFNHLGDRSTFSRDNQTRQIAFNPLDLANIVTRRRKRTSMRV